MANPNGNVSTSFIEGRRRAGQRQSAARKANRDGRPGSACYVAGRRTAPTTGGYRHRMANSPLGYARTAAGNKRCGTRRRIRHGVRSI